MGIGATIGRCLVRGDGTGEGGILYIYYIYGISLYFPGCLRQWNFSYFLEEMDEGKHFLVNIHHVSKLLKA